MTIKYITVPVADLRKTPEFLPQDLSHCDRRLSQLLKGEAVRVEEVCAEWLRVSALCQPKFGDGKWISYPGWVHASEVGERRSPSPLLSKTLWEAAGPFLGKPYLWGGCAPSAVDCSGLVHLVYRAMGRVIPRDAHDQFLRTDGKKREQLNAGDLVFLAKGRRVDHVLLYLGGDEIIEAPQTGENVRIISLEQRLRGVTSHVFFGTPLRNENIA